MPARPRWSPPTPSTHFSTRTGLQRIRPGIHARERRGHRGRVPRRQAAAQVHRTTTCAHFAARGRHVPLAVRFLQHAGGCPVPTVRRGSIDTYMIPNNHPDPGTVRLDQLCDAIKLVYASTFFHARQVLPGGHLQPRGGGEDGGHHPAGGGPPLREASSTPTSRARPSPPITTPHGERESLRTAWPGGAGPGPHVVEGGRCLRFSPHGRRNASWQFATMKDTLREQPATLPGPGRERPRGAIPHCVTRTRTAGVARPGRPPRRPRHADEPVGSVYSPENDAIYDGIHRPGPRLVTFAHVLKSGMFPLADDRSRSCSSWANAA